MNEVVKTELLKLLNAGIVYLIKSSKCISPTQIISKKSGVAIIKNEDGEIVPTRTAMSWRTCIAYRKLNKVIRKDHFPLHFLDQVLKKVAKHEFYYFLR